MPTYRIVRFYRDHPGKDTDGMPSGLTEAEAKAWCGDPETSSVTATSRAARAVTAALGPWFDGYEAEAPDDDDPACGSTATTTGEPCGWPAGHEYPHQ